MHRIIILILAFFYFGTLLAQNRQLPQPKLSASARLFLWKLKKEVQKSPKGIFPENVYYQDENNRLYVNSFLKVFPELQPENLRKLGVKVGTRAGNIWTAKVPVDAIENFTHTPGIQYIDLDQASSPDLDSARRRTRTDSAQMGFTLPQSVSGKNVVVGIIDAGFDYSHPTFYDTTYSRYRVKKVWEQKAAGQSPSGFGYGAEYADSAAILNKAYDILDGTHGTHVGGIAGGSGYLGPNDNHRRFRGMAYESDLVFTAIYPTAAYWLNTGMVDMLDGIQYTFQYAESQGKPAVANLSWGCPLGPRDGSSLFSQAINNLVGPGKIFVLSGGNNGQNRIHVDKSFTPTDTLLNTFVTFPSSLPQKINQVDVWGDTARSFCMQFSLYSGANRIRESAWICLQDSVHEIFLIGGNGDTCFITASVIKEEFNLKPHILIQLKSRVNENLCFTVKATEGSVHMWQGIVVKTSGYYGTFAKNNQTWARDGNYQMTTGDMVSTRRAIAVAAYNSKVNFTNVSGTGLTYSGYSRGRIAAFSSMGPTADGRVKPNIAGPGMALASSINSYDSSYMSGGGNYDVIVSKSVSPQNNRTYAYGMAGGTSMSAPATSGIVAFLLQLQPNLEPEAILNTFSQTAIKDNFTGVIPSGGSNIWGFGKVNALGAIRHILNPLGIGFQKLGNSCLVFPNPGNQIFYFESPEFAINEKDIQVMDALGRRQIHAIIQSLGSAQYTIDLGQLPAGLYLIQVNGPRGIEVIRVIKQ